MKQDLKELWQQHLNPQELAVAELEITKFKTVNIASSKKQQLLNYQPVTTSWVRPMIPLAALGLFLIVMFGWNTPSRQQTKEQTTATSDAQLTALLSFYLEDDNFNLTLSELSITEEEL